MIEGLIIGEEGVRKRIFGAGNAIRGKKDKQVQGGMREQRAMMSSVIARLKGLCVKNTTQVRVQGLGT